jgi:hypothetical protein
MNASPQQRLYPLSQKAVITLSALDFLFTTRCGKLADADEVNQSTAVRTAISRPIQLA